MKLITTASPPGNAYPLTLTSPFCRGGDSSPRGRWFPQGDPQVIRAEQGFEFTPAWLHSPHPTFCPQKGFLEKIKIKSQDPRGREEFLSVEAFLEHRRSKYRHMPASGSGVLCGRAWSWGPGAGGRLACHTFLSELL